VGRAARSSGASRTGCSTASKATTESSSRACTCPALPRLADLAGDLRGEASTRSCRCPVAAGRHEGRRRVCAACNALIELLLAAPELSEGAGRQLHHTWTPRHGPWPRHPARAQRAARHCRFHPVRRRAARSRPATAWAHALRSASPRRRRRCRRTIEGTRRITCASCPRGLQRSRARLGSDHGLGGRQRVSAPARMTTPARSWTVAPAPAHRSTEVRWAAVDAVMSCGGPHPERSEGAGGRQFHHTLNAAPWRLEVPRGSRESARPARSSSTCRRSRPCRGRRNEATNAVGGQAPFARRR
jgi:hypothetical protein